MDKVHFERRLGAQLLKTYRDNMEIDKLMPNDQQPRPDWDIPDEELQTQIETNRGLWEPILVEPQKDSDKFLIIDGHRRWRNCKALVESQEKKEYNIVPVEVLERPLSPTERLMIWVYIHRQREEWDTMVKEGVAWALVNIVGKPSAAAYLGLKLTEVDKLCQVYEFAKNKFPGLKNPLAAITWATEILGLPEKLVAPEIQEKIVAKVNKGKITNSKDIRKLRKILKDDNAKAEFLKADGDINSAMEKIEPTPPSRKSAQGLEHDLEELKSIAEGALSNYPWPVIQKFRGKPDAIQKIRDCESVLIKLRKALEK